MSRRRSLSPRSASTPPIGISTMFAVASARATMASQAVECVRSHAVHDTATAWMKKLSHERIEPSEYQRKLRSPKASAMPPRPNVKARPTRRPLLEHLPRSHAAPRRHAAPRAAPLQRRPRRSAQRPFRSTPIRGSGGWRRAPARVDSHRGQHMRRRDLAGRAGRARAHRDSGEIERDHQRRGFDAWNRKANRIGQPRRGLGKDHRISRDRTGGHGQTVAQFRQPRRSAAASAGTRPPRRRTPRSSRRPRCLRGRRAPGRRRA